MCSCWSRRIHPTLEKLVVQNIAALEYQGKQLKLSEHWIMQTGMTQKKYKKINWIQVLTEDFLSYKFKIKIFKAKKVTQ